MSCNYSGNCGNQVGGAQSYLCQSELEAVKRSLKALERCLVAATGETPRPRPCRCRCCCCCCCRNWGGTGNQTTWGR